MDLTSNSIHFVGCDRHVISYSDDVFCIRRVPAMLEFENERVRKLKTHNSSFPYIVLTFSKQIRSSGSSHCAVKPGPARATGTGNTLTDLTGVTWAGAASLRPPWLVIYTGWMCPGWNNMAKQRYKRTKRPQLWHKRGRYLTFQ